MRETDLELIAALVEGRLDDESEARALIESSAELREEYEAQKLAYETLTGAGTASLSEVERSSLHRDVWTALRQHPAPPSSNRGWYVRLAAVAAGLFLVVGLAAVLGQGGADQADFTEIAADLADGPADSEESADRDAAGGDDSAADDGAATFEDSSAATTTAAASEMAPGTEMLSPDYLTEQADRVRAGEFSDQLRAYDAASDEEFAECVMGAGLDEHVAVAVLTPPVEMTGDTEVHLVAAVSEEEETADASVAFVDLGTCQLVYIDD